LQRIVSGDPDCPADARHRYGGNVVKQGMTVRSGFDLDDSPPTSTAFHRDRVGVIRDERDAGAESD
jgi:hypothetical protein